ncbi:MAG: transcriptional regulator [Lachnospiraceae bacterium]|mgnify:CR=1 FL=1|nr:transcriptional regulator [Lachnospiraceae bacterium]
MGALATVPGVISEAPSYYLGAAEVMNYLGCRENKAYEVIRGLRKELIDAGKLYPGVPQGRIPKKYFLERCMIEEV